MPRKVQSGSGWRWSLEGVRRVPYRLPQVLAAIERGETIYVVEGEIHEYASNCAVPIVHKAGEIRPETNPTEHWWENKGKKTVVLFVGDVLHDKTDKNM